MKEIILTQDKVAIVDDEDFEWLNQWKWTLHKGRHTDYAARYEPMIKRVRGKYTLMHRQILGLTGHKIGDHKDRNGLNNQRSNLRIAGYSQNGANAVRVGGTSIYKGVHFHKERGKWAAHITKNYKNNYIGLFDDEVSAAAAYNLAAKKMHGEFAILNVI